MTEPYAKGEIITFYSYKGGVGRSMALANVARLLAAKGKRVLVIDWDLDAPGLAEYFQRRRPSRQGLVHLFTSLRSKLNKRSFQQSLETEDMDAIGRALEIDAYVAESGAPGVHLISAGDDDPEYARLVAEFQWGEFYERFPKVITGFRDLLGARYDYVLIDSRTGVSDVSGLCTSLLPHKLVAVFASNRQNLRVLEVVKAALQHRRFSEPSRPLVVFPLPSRFDTSDFRNMQSWFTDFRKGFEQLLKTSYDLRQCDLTSYFEEVLLLYVPQYSYGEQIAVLPEEPNYVGSLRRAYESFARRLQKDHPWRGDGPSRRSRSK